MLVLDLGGAPDLVLAATVGAIPWELIAAPADARPAGHVTAKLAGALKHVPAARLGELEPPAFSPGGRRWTLANVRDGVLHEAPGPLGLNLDPGAHTRNAYTSLRSP